MSEHPPKTPPPTSSPRAVQGDTFEDGPNITPKPRAYSPAATRSLTDRRTSSASNTPSIKDRIKNLEASTKPADVVAGDNEGSKVDQLDGGVDKKPAPRKISVSSLDEVHLDEGEPNRNRSPTRASISSNKNSTISLSRTSSHELQPTPIATHNATSPDKSLASSISTNAANMSRRFNSPFSWLARATTADPKKVASQPPLMSPTYEHRKSDPDQRQSQSSLKDRFKAARMREEAGITSVGDDFVVGSPDVSSPMEDAKSPGSTRNMSISSQTFNPNLPPGTAAGFTEGPRGDAAPVDWDLWQTVVSEGPSAVSRTSDEELRKAISGGIPQVIRGVIWQVLAGSKNEDMESFYGELVLRGTEKERLNNINHAETNGNGQIRDSMASSASSIQSEKSSPPATTNPNSPAPSVDGFTNPLTPKPKSAKEEVAHIQSLEKTIRRDLGARTSYSKYLMASGLQDGLFGICKAYALYDEEVGYAQGMNFIAMPLLFNMPEAEAFCLFVRLMSKYGLRNMFTQDMPGLHLHLYQFERLLEDFEPALYCHLHRRGVTPDLYATQWFLTLFAYRFPLQLVQRIYDLILSDGLESSILRFGIILMQKNKEALLEMRDMSQISQFLKEKLFDVYIDKAPSAGSILESGFFGSTGGIDKEVYKADQLVQDACDVNISQELLKTYTTEWEEKRRAEKERELELETLRSQATTLSVKVRRLEERAEKSDTEHVQMASELVRTKVDNEALLDENESLKGQVEELKQVVSRQTEEVEQRLKAEMDEVMRRNIEVHNVNRALEEEKQEMERALVETKMMHAQVNSEHESLKERWNNVAKLMK